MFDASASMSDWDGQLPPHIARNEQIWWAVFPHIKTYLPYKLLRFLGGAKESPSRETIGKVICIADTKADLRQRFGPMGGSLLNHWDCYCSKIIDEGNIVCVAGTMTKPHLTFQISLQSSLLFICPRFGRRIEPTIADTVQKLEQSHIETLKRMDLEPELEGSEVSVLKFKRGSWENGLDMAFKAAIWVRSNQEEALANIWKIRPKWKW